MSDLQSVCSNLQLSSNTPVEAPLQFPLPLSRELCFKIAKHVHENEALAFAMTSRDCRDAMKAALRERTDTGATRKRRKVLLTTRLGRYRARGLAKEDVESPVLVSRDWIIWAFLMKWEYKGKGKYNEQRKGKMLTEFAARGGFKNVLMWLESHGCDFTKEAVYVAALGGHLEVLEYLRSEGCSLAWAACSGAVQGGHVKILEYLKSEKVKFDGLMMSCGAARCGQVGVLKYLKREKVKLYGGMDNLVVDSALEGGHVKVLEYLKSEGVSFRYCHTAAKEGHIHVLKYLKSEGVPFDSLDCRLAAEGGQIKVLKYLKSKGMEFDEGTCRGAAEGGHIHVLEYLKNEGVAFDEEACAGAAYGGHIKVLQYLKNEGVTYGSYTCAWGARGGSLEFLKYLKSEGVPFDDPYICYEALKGWEPGFRVLKWLRSEEVNCPWNIQDCLIRAYAHNTQEARQWIETFTDWRPDWGL